MSPEELIEKVDSKATFLEFLEALIADREKAEELEREAPSRFQWGGANNWQNSSISSFLGAAHVFFLEGRGRHEGTDLSWSDLANFLYFGKIYE